ncbi:hypothetical protein PENSPDRAFT_190564 [Peniophora sp. CONT]|nr:hypothetical protein PENSPDRAFT_190564 [Peniophora sp. CONT]
MLTIIPLSFCLQNMIMLVCALIVGRFSCCDILYHIHTSHTGSEWSETSKTAAVLSYVLFVLKMGGFITAEAGGKRVSIVSVRSVPYGYNLPPKLALRFVPLILLTVRCFPSVRIRVAEFDRASQRLPVR